MLAVSGGLWRRSRIVLVASALVATLVAGATAALYRTGPVVHAASRAATGPTLTVAPANAQPADCPQFPNWGQLKRDPTDAEIAQDDLPPRPHNPDGLKAWSQAMRAATVHICHDSPGVVHTHVHNGNLNPRRPQYGGYYYVNNNTIWSGYVAPVNGSTTGHGSIPNVTDAYVNFSAPCIPPGMDRGNKASSHWLGLGGWGGTNLLQAGTYSNDDSGAHCVV